MLATLCKPSESVTTPNIRESDILYGLNPPGRVTREYLGSSAAKAIVRQRRPCPSG